MTSEATDTSKLAIVVLASGTNDHQLFNILSEIRTNILPWTPGDVMVFHTGDYEDQTRQNKLRAVLPAAKLHRIPIEYWTLPPGLSEDDAPKWNYAKCCPLPQHGIGYRHMCRWYSNGIFKYLRRYGYKWILRLDEDSEVLSPVQVNMVKWMEANNKLYGFRALDGDDTEVTWGLPELTAWFIVKNKMQPHHLYKNFRPRSSAGLNSMGGWNKVVIYNNMFMANIEWWMDPKVSTGMPGLLMAHATCMM